VEFVAADRKTESLAAYYAQLTDTQRTALHAVAMDMWEQYISATREGLPAGQEKIVFDRFHIMREMTKAVDPRRSIQCGSRSIASFCAPPRRHP
jgi:transposase